MKNLLRYLAALAAAASALAGLDLAGIIHLIPDPYAAWVAVTPAIGAAAYHFILAVGDIVDDGKKNDSFRLPAVLLPMLAVVLAFSMSSCAGIYSGITGQPVASTSVQRAGHPESPIIQVASGDLAQAEAGDPLTVHGLYNAGLVAARIGEAIDAGK